MIAEQIVGQQPPILAGNLIVFSKVFVCIAL